MRIVNTEIKILKIIIPFKIFLFAIECLPFIESQKFMIMKIYDHDLTYKWFGLKHDRGYVMENKKIKIK